MNIQKFIQFSLHHEWRPSYIFICTRFTCVNVRCWYSFVLGTHRVLHSLWIPSEELWKFRCVFKLSDLIWFNFSHCYVVTFTTILSPTLKGTAVKALKNVPYNSELNLWIGDKRLVKLIYEVCIVFMFEIYSALKICK